MIEKIEQQDAMEAAAVADELSDEALDRPERSPSSAVFAAIPEAHRLFLLKGKKP